MASWPRRGGSYFETKSSPIIRGDAIAALELPPEPNGSVRDPGQLSDKVGQDLKEIFQEPECSSKHDGPRQHAGMFHPMSSAKYYSYEKQPTQVEVPLDDGVFTN